MLELLILEDSYLLAILGSFFLVPDHIQCGSGRSRPALGERYRERGGGKGGNSTGGPAPGRTFLRQRRHGRLVGTRLDPGRIYCPGRSL